MKKNILVLAMILAITLTGCNNLNNNITNQDYNAIADYIASMVLKYDRSYDEKLIDPAIIAEASSIVDKSSKEISNVIPVSNNVAAVDDGLVNGEEFTGNIEDSKEIVDYKTLSEVMGFDNLDIQYGNYKLYDSFPEEKDKEYFNLEAGKNNKLCVIQFNIKNKTSKNEKFNLLNKEIKYQLDIDSNSYTPLLTLLVNDIQFIDITIKGEKKVIGVLVFEVSKDIKLDKANLLVSRDSLKSSIALK